MPKAAKIFVVGLFSVLVLAGIFWCSDICFNLKTSLCENGFLAAISNGCPLRKNKTSVPASIKPEILSFEILPQKEILFFSRNLISLEVFAKINGKERVWGRAAFKGNENGLQKWSFSIAEAPLLAEEVWAVGQSSGTKEKTIFMSLPFSGTISVFQTLFVEPGRSVFEKKFHEPQKLFSGETLISEDGAVAVTLLEVFDDSRCPVDVQCVWAGKVSARFRIDSIFQLPEERVAILDPRDADLSEPYIHGYRLQLISIGPERFSNKEISKNSYYVFVSVVKLLE